MTETDIRDTQRERPDQRDRSEDDTLARAPAAPSPSSDRSPDEIAREIETIRAHLTGTLDEIRGRMTPGQIADQAMSYLRGSGSSEFARNIGRSVRDNPLPILLIGAGIGWLMTANGRRGAAAGPELGDTEPPRLGKESGPDAAAWARDHASDVGAEARRTAEGISQSVSDMASSARERAERTTGAAGEGLHGLRDKAGAAGERTGAMAHDARAGLQRFGTQARDNWSRLAHEQPLVLGAIGLAVGAALGAGVPNTRFENRLMGSTSDALKEKASGAAATHYEKVKEAASETYHEVADDMEKRGLSADQIADTAASAARKAGDKAEKISEDAKSDMQPGASANQRPKEGPGATASRPTSAPEAKPEDKPNESEAAKPGTKRS